MVGIGDVAGDRDHAGEPGNRTLEPRRPTRIYRELPTAPRKGTSEREPQPTRCAGDDPSHTRHPQERCRRPIGRLPARASPRIRSFVLRRLFTCPPRLIDNSSGYKLKLT